jgi:hypothetical protein
MELFGNTVPIRCRICGGVAIWLYRRQKGRIESFTKWPATCETCSDQRVWFGHPLGWWEARQKVSMRNGDGD